MRLRALAVVLACRPLASFAGDNADTIIRDFAKFYQDAPTFQANVIALYRVQGSGLNTRDANTFTLAVRRPNSLCLISTAGRRSATFVSDGVVLTTYLPEINDYTVRSAPPTLDAIYAETTRLLDSRHAALRYLLTASILNAFQGTTPQYAGEEKVDQIPAHRLDLGSASIWIAAGEQPLLLKYEAVTRNPPDEIPRTMTRTVLFNDWKINPALEATTFKFVSPPGARKVNFLSPSP